MELIRVGYKQTEAGLIPEDWELVPLGDCFDFKNGLNKAKDFFGYGIPIVNYLDVYLNAGISIKELKGKVNVSPLEIRNFSIRKGDVLFTRTSETPEEIGISAVIIDGGEEAVFSGFLLRARPLEKPIDLHFKKYCFKSAIVRDQITSKASYTTRALTNGRALSKVFLPLPSTLAEQQAIATALGDADALITGLDTLIAKKRAIKEGTSQELLSGNRRLPGFEGEWVEEEFGELAKRRKEKYTSKQPEEQHFCIELEHIQPTTGLLLGHLDTIPLATTKTAFKKDDVLFGRLRAYLKKYWFASSDGLASTEIWALEAMGKMHVPRYLYYLVQTSGFLRSASESYGTHMPRSDWNSVSKTTFRVPASREEQSAIAAILSDMDAEIATLETKLQKARAIKAGMMAELLTGKIRLI